MGREEERRDREWLNYDVAAALVDIIHYMIHARTVSNSIIVCAYSHYN